MTKIRFSDAARRCSDIVTQASLNGHLGKWLAIRLSDGGGDNVVYDTRPQAVQFQRSSVHVSMCMFIQIPLDGMPPQHAERVLAFHRMVYDSGHRMTDPEDPRHVVMPYTMEQYEREVSEWLTRNAGRLGRT